MAFLLQIDALDLTGSVAVPLRACSVDDPDVCHLDGHTWKPVIATLPTLRYDIFGGDFGRLESPDSAVQLAVVVWPDFATYRLSDARLRLWHGETGADFEDYTLRFDGRVRGEAVIAEGRADISFGVDDLWRDRPLLETYLGTGGLEGPLDQRGVVKPLALGAPLGAGAVLLDSVRSIYQIHGYGPIKAVTLVLERLARQYGSALADYGTLTALASASVPAGSWATCLAQGLVRFGAPPYGRVCFMVEGDYPDSAWPRLPGALLARLADLAGHGDAVDMASMAALDTACPYPLSVWQSGQTSTRAMMEQIAGSVNAAVGMTWLGQLVAVPIAINTAGLVLAVDGSREPAAFGLKTISVAAPYWRLTLGVRPFWQVHGPGEIANYEPIVPIYAASAEPPANPQIGQGWKRVSDGRLFVYTGSAMASGVDYITSSGSHLISSGWVEVRDGGVSDALDTSGSALDTAQAAGASVDQILSDGFLSSDEKPAFIKEMNTLLSERAALDTQADDYAITTEKAAYDGAVDALQDELDLLYIPTRWDSASGLTELGASPVRVLIEAVYSTRRALTIKIADLARLGLNADGTVKDDKVSTTALVPNAVTSPSTTVLSSDVALTNSTNVQIISLTFTKAIADSDLDLQADISFASTDNVVGAFTFYTVVSGTPTTLLGSTDLFIRGNGATRLGQTLRRIITSLGAGTHTIGVYFLATAGNGTQQAKTGSVFSIREFKR